MIIGNGLVANALKNINSKDICFFASGVSNSSETDSKKFERERYLLEDTIKDLNSSTVLVYFSSCGVQFEKNMYYSHKLNMETIVSSRKNFYVFRLPQVIGQKGNSNTLFNFLFKKIQLQESIELWRNATRNFIDIEDIVFIIKNIIDKRVELNTIIDIASPYNLSMQEIIENIEIFLNKKIKYTLVDKGKSFEINIDKICSNVDMGSIFGENKNTYLQKIIKKYYKDKH